MDPPLHQRQKLVSGPSDGAHTRWLGIHVASLGLRRPSAWAAGTLGAMTAPPRMGLRAWVAGARPRTLPAAIAPVAAGTGAAAIEDAVVPGKALLCLALALALQVGVNYANDYADGIRGTDDDRVGPIRLVGSGLAAPATVRAAAVGALALAAVIGLALTATSSWWLLLVGAAALAAAWGYTGGSRPYGYRALGELSVFVFFGLVAVVGTTFVQVGRITAVSVAAGIGVGALACAILVANNLRDIETDGPAGKRTLAVLLGDRGTRRLYAALVVLAFAVLGVVAASYPWVLLGLVAAPVLARAQSRVRSGATGSALIEVLSATGIGQLLYALGLTAGLVVG